ncbi:MAG: hypothetical protein NTW86_03415, partial [Candidatus Sumerlaeota bacterium]|nr:hypothetical protein [Candidatus Sumerlaeota bacterium]
MAKLYLPPGARWSCHNSTCCCRQFPEFPATGEDVERIAALPRERIAPGLSSEQPWFHKSVERPDQVVLATIQGRCCFLTPEGLCAIHAQFGAEAKPIPCREFPFLFTRGPDGVYVGLAFSCPSVIRNEGQPVEEHASWLGELYPSAFAVRSLPERIELSHGLPLEWDDYLLVEERLQRLLALEGVSLEDRLIAGSVWLGMLDLFLRQARDRTMAPAQQAIRAFADSIERMIAFRDSLRAPRGRLNVAGTILWNYLRHALRLGEIRPAPDEPPFRYRDLRRVRFDLGQPALAEMMRRYFVHLIFRKDIVRRGNVVEGYHLLLFDYAATRWFALARAAARGARAVEEDDLAQAISLTERHYGAHSWF